MGEGAGTMSTTQKQNAAPGVMIPADIKRTLLDALKTEEEEYGETAETVNARLWVESDGRAFGDDPMDAR